MSASRLAMRRSSARRAGHAVATAAGPTTPSARSAPRLPSSAITGEVTAAPNATPRRPERFEGCERACHHGVGRQACGQRVGADVDERVADSDRGEEQQRGGRLGRSADDGERGARKDHSDAEAAGVTAIPGDRRGEQRADQRAEPDRRVEHADVGVPAAEEVDRHDDHEHGRAAAQERLHEGERGDQPEPRIRPEREQALADLPCAAAAHRARVPGLLVRW